MAEFIDMPDYVRAEFAAMTDSERGFYIKGLREGASGVTAALEEGNGIPGLRAVGMMMMSSLITKILTEFPDTRMVD